MEEQNLSPAQTTVQEETAPAPVPDAPTAEESAPEAPNTAATDVFDNVSVDELPAAAPLQPPVVEEQRFSGALFGFKRSQVLEYVRSMSEQTAAYATAAEEQRQALCRQLTRSGQRLEAQKQRIAELNADLEELTADDARLQARYDQMEAEFQACREKLFHREQKYVQLQRECNDLRSKNAEITAQIDKARELIRQHKERYDQEVARHAQQEQALRQSQQEAEQQLTAQHAAEMEKLQNAAAQKEQALREENQQELQTLGNGAQEMLSRLGSRVDAEQARLARSVEQVDADLSGLRQDMEHVQQQIWAAHAMIRQTTTDMNELLQRMPAAVGTPAQPAGTENQPDGTAQAPAGAASDAADAAKDVQPVGDKTLPFPQEVVGKTQSDAAQQDKTQPAEPPVQPAGESGAQASAPSGEKSANRHHTARRNATVRLGRDTVADYLLDALGRLWDKK